MNIRRENILNLLKKIIEIYYLKSLLFKLLKNLFLCLFLSSSSSSGIPDGILHGIGDCVIYSSIKKFDELFYNILLIIHSMIYETYKQDLNLN